jgi:hypothetical protein
LVFGALAGVALGSWLSARAQRGLLVETRRQAMRQLQLEACITLLESHRKLINFVLMEAQNVVLVTREYDQLPHGQIDDQTPLFDEVNAAEARLRTVISKHSPIRPAADALDKAFESLAAARARYGRGHVPVEMVKATREVEDQFSQTVYEQLVASQIHDNAVPGAWARRTPATPGKRSATPDAVHETASEHT